MATAEAMAALELALADPGLVERVLCEGRLRDFVRQGWAVLEPGTPHVHGRVVDAVCEHLGLGVEPYCDRQIEDQRAGGFVDKGAAAGGDHLGRSGQQPLYDPTARSSSWD